MTVRQSEGSASLLELATRLVADIRRLFEQRLELLKAELTLEATCVARAVGVLTAGAIGAGLGAACSCWSPSGCGSGICRLDARGPRHRRRRAHRHSAWWRASWPSSGWNASGSHGQRASELRRDAEWIRNGA